MSVSSTSMEEKRFLPPGYALSILLYNGRKRRAKTRARTMMGKNGLNTKKARIDINAPNIKNETISNLLFSIGKVYHAV